MGRELHLDALRSDFDAHFGGGAALEYLLYQFGLRCHLGFRAVQLAQKDRCGIDRVAGVHEVLGRADRRVVHHLQPAGQNAGGNDFSNRVAGFSDVVEGGQ